MVAIQEFNGSYIIKHNKAQRKNTEDRKGTIKQLARHQYPILNIDFGLIVSQVGSMSLGKQQVIG